MTPGACSRPLDFAEVTRHLAGSPALASVFPFTTTSRATEHRNDCPALAVADESDEPVRTVTCVPDGIVAALSDSEMTRNAAKFKASLPFIVPPERVGLQRMAA